MNDLKKRQRGNVLFIILIAVVLFAALGFAVSNILQSGDPTTIANEQSRVFAGEILDYGRNMRQAVQSIRISNGCRDTEISFENPIETGYVNGTNTECQVFHPDGGGMSWVSPANGVNDGGEWVINGRGNVGDVGSTDPDLGLYLVGLNQNICRQINRLVDIDGIPEDNGDLVDGLWPSKFTGSYSTANGITGPTNSCPDILCGQLSGCFQEEGGGQLYIFYQVLLSR